jgi:UDP-glucuronate 4-epimerase
LNGDGSSRRDFTYIYDVITVIQNLIQLDNFPEGILNIGAGNDYSINEMISIIEDISGLKVKLDQTPRYIKEIAKTKSNSEKMKKILGNFSYMPLQTGISQTFDWAKSTDVKNNLESWIKST